LLPSALPFKAAESKVILNQNLIQLARLDANTMKQKIVVGVAGMPGAGKQTVNEITSGMGYLVVVMGDVVRRETERRGLEPTPDNLGKIMLKLREEEGPTVMAKRCIPEIDAAESRVVVVDGVRSLREVDELKKSFPNFMLIAIHASPETRFQRLFQRNRSDDPKGWKTFVERDLRELSVGLGGAIATADYMIVNEGTKTEFKRSIRKVLEVAVSRWMK